MPSTRSRRGPVWRLTRASVVLLLLLVVVFYAGGGWYFSGRIDSDALQVKPYPAERNLTLTPLGADRLRVSSSDDAEMRMLTASSTYGVKWTGGYGRVSGPVVLTSGQDVVRRFEVVSGIAPSAGTRGEIDLVAFPEDPTYPLGDTVRTVTYTSPVGRFPAYLRPGRNGSTWAVLVHGKGGSRTEMYRMDRSLAATGLTTLDITYRNDEGLPRDPSGRYQYGRTEWRDVASAVRYAAAHGAERVVLGADSMGGGIVASYLRHRPERSPEVIGLVLDAPMLDFAETIRFGAQQLSLPLVGPVPDSLTWTARAIAGQRFDVDWDAVDYLSDTSWVRAPTLVFHGTADTTVPISTSRELARDQPGRVSLVVTAGVEHVRSWNADPAAYAGRIRSFVEGLPTG